MNKFQSLLLPLLAVMAFMFTACGEDDTPPPSPIAPTVSLISGTGLVTAVDTLAPLDEFTLRVSAVSGNSNMLSITVSEDGTTIDDLGRITFDGTAGSANPILLFNADTAEFTKDISIIAHGTAAETHTYTISVRDENGQTSEVSVDIYTEEPVVIVTTPLDETYTGRMFANADGPNPDGGMDLSEGMAVSANSAMANIVDAGIDLNLPAASNWIQKIEPANNAVLTVPAAGFDYDGVTTKEAITEGYNLSTEVTTTDKVQTGDVFFVNTVEATYVFKVTEVTVTAGDNLDNYTLEIKY